MSEPTHYRRLLVEALAESYWKDYEEMVKLEEALVDKASQRWCRRGQLHYKTLALIFQDRSRKLRASAPKP